MKRAKKRLRVGKLFPVTTRMESTVLERLTKMVGTIAAYFPDLGFGYLNIDGCRIGFKQKAVEGKVKLERGTKVRAWVNENDFAERLESRR